MRKDLMISLGKAARLARKERGLTQANTAERLDVSVEFYGRIERGTACPSMEIFVRLVAILDASADALLGLDAAHLPAGPPPLTTPEDPPELRELAELLPGARPETLRVVRALLTEIDRARAARKRSKNSQTGSTPGKGTPGKSTPGKSTPGKGKPGKSTPGKSTPGKSTPGKSTPGKGTPGKGKPGKSTPGKSTQAKRARAKGARKPPSSA